MLVTNLANHQKPWFVGGLGGNFHQHGVLPQLLGLYKVHAMFGAVGIAFCWIELKDEHGIKIIPTAFMTLGGLYRAKLKAAFVAAAQSPHVDAPPN